MFENFSIPLSYSLIKRGKVYLLLKNEYKDLLLEQGIEDVGAFLQRYHQTSKYLKGRGLHPSVPLEDGKRIVIRHYLHGGLFSAFTRDLFFFGSRSFHELVLTEEIIACGLSTIEPIGAIHQAGLPFYQAYLLSLELPQAVDLAQYFQEMSAHPSGERLLLKRKMIRSAGFLLRQFHQAGFFHGDLQLKNILVSGDRLLLIDFDHSYRKPSLSYGERVRNLLRLNRSAEKWKRIGLPVTRTDRMRFFLAYADDDVTIKGKMRNVFRTYALRYFFFRCGWILDKIFHGK